MKHAKYGKAAYSCTHKTRSALASAPASCSPRPEELQKSPLSPAAAAGPAGAGGRLAPSPAKANCGVARETGGKNRTAGWLRVGEAETTTPAKPPSVILGPIRAEAVAFCSLFTKHSPGEGEEGEGRKSRASTVPVPLLPPPWRIPSGAGQGEGVN